MSDAAFSPAPSSASGPAEDPRLRQPVAVFVPVTGHPSIRPRSAVVGSLEGDRLMLDLQDPRDGVEQFSNFADRVHHAHGRHVTRYPTVARVWLADGQVISVGEYDPVGGVVSISDDVGARMLARWLEVRELTEDMLQTQTVMAHDIRRSCERALASRDPRHLQAARLMARRHRLDIPGL